MSEVRLVLSSEDYVTLYSQLAERRMQAFQDADKRRYSQWGETPVIVEDAQGNTSYSDWAQEEFDDECGIIENFLAETGIVQEEL
jgi:hypothetical protein